MKRENLWHRRHAIQMVAQLPEEAEDALVVLDLARELVLVFLSGSKPPPNKPTVVSIRGGDECA